MKDTLKILKNLYKSQKITSQQYRTYRGQVLSGNTDGCLKGLQKKKINWEREEF